MYQSYLDKTTKTSFFEASVSTNFTLFPIKTTIGEKNITSKQKKITTFATPNKPSPYKYD